MFCVVFSNMNHDYWPPREAMKHVCFGHPVSLFWHWSFDWITWLKASTCRNISGLNWTYEWRPAYELVLDTLLKIRANDMPSAFLLISDEGVSDWRLGLASFRRKREIMKKALSTSCKSFCYHQGGGRTWQLWIICWWHLWGSQRAAAPVMSQKNGVLDMLGLLF